MHREVADLAVGWSDLASPTADRAVATTDQACWCGGAATANGGRSRPRSRPGMGSKVFFLFFFFHLINRGSQETASEKVTLTVTFHPWQLQKSSLRDLARLG